LACGPEFSVEFSAPPEFSGGVTEKNLSAGWARTANLQIMNQVFYHCATAALYVRHNNIHTLPCWDFPAVSVVSGSRIFRPYLVVTCQDFPAVSAVTGSQIFRPYQVVTCRDFPAVSAVTGSQIFRRICSYLPGFSGLTFSGTRRPGFSGRICCFWPGFSGRSFSGMGNLKKLYGQQANCSGIYSGIFCP
jgi:hypothetical protein